MLRFLRLRKPKNPARSTRLGVVEKNNSRRTSSRVSVFFVKNEKTQSKTDKFTPPFGRFTRSVTRGPMGVKTPLCDSLGTIFAPFVARLPRGSEMTEIWRIEKDCLSCNRKQSQRGLRKPIYSPLYALKKDCLSRKLYSFNH